MDSARGVRRARHDLELVHAGRTLPVHGAQAVGAGVAAADDDDLLALGGDRRLPVVAEHVVALLHPVGPRQVLHRLVDAVQLAAGNRQIARSGRAAGQHHRVELGAQLLGGDVDADVDAGAELGALGPHLVQAPVEVALFHLEFRDAVAQQPADAVVALEHRHACGRRGSAAGRRPDRPDPNPPRPPSCRSARRAAAAPPSLRRRRLSMISSSICLIVTGSWLIPSTHAGSHGAGHSRPVKSGKLLVACSRSIASRQRPCAPGRSIPESGCPADNRCGRTEYRSPCSGSPGARSVSSANSS